MKTMRRIIITFIYPLTRRAGEESEFLSALNASLEFCSQNSENEQTECIRRIVYHGRNVLAMLPGDGIRQERYIS